MNELANLVVVEDDSTIRTILEMMLRAAGFVHVQSVARGDEGLTLITRTKPDLVLLDIMLPGLDGLSICRRIRATAALADTRIMMITARTQNEDIVRGLESGADDYVTKPFDRAILLARIQAVLRRTAAPPVWDGLSLDNEGRTATLNGEDLHLTPGEFRLLALLAAHPGRVLARSRILDALAGTDDRAVTERTVDVQVVGLRKKLGTWAAHLETIRGVGYRVKS